MVTLASGMLCLKKIIDELDVKRIRNEAKTRFDIIDEIIISCFGWDKSLIEVENCEGRKYTDYEIGKPRQIIVEAKKEGILFELPLGNYKENLVDIPSLIYADEELQKAVNQVQDYCIRRGVPVAVVTNGHQIIAFLASRSDGISPLNGNALVYTSLEILYKNFQFAWKMFSQQAVQEKNLMRYLSTGESSVPIKLSSKLKVYPKIRYASELQQSLRQLSELIIQDTIEDERYEKEFYENCYCENGALSKYALLSKSILKARYAALFPESESSPALVSVKPSKSEESLDPTVLAESISKRPIVLLGDVGVGKTSFLKNLMFSSSYDVFSSAIYIYIDLGSQATLSDSLKDYILLEIEKQLLEKYSIDIYDEKFVKGAYSSEIMRFENSIWGNIKESNRPQYDLKLFEKVDELLSNKDRHAKRSIIHISNLKKRQIIVAIDNADQRDFETQQTAFIISQELARDWNVFSFISVRPKTFFSSKRAGAFTAYPHKVFTISPPRIDVVVEKRLKFALTLAKGESHFGSLAFIKLNLKTLQIFIRALLYSFEKNHELIEFLENITGGNVRAAIEFISKFIGSPNVNAEKIIDIFSRTGDYTIPIHEFTKQAILGDFSHYEPSTSITLNMFDVSSPDPKEHFMSLFVLAYLYSDQTNKDKDGFCLIEDVFKEMQNNGFTQEQVSFSISRCINKKLIEYPQRITDEEGVGDLFSDKECNKFRITTIGAYHFLRWVGDFAYLDAMLFDTPIFDPACESALEKRIESFDIRDRYGRTVAFKEYLMACWQGLVTHPTYLNFPALVAMKDQTFIQVETAIRRFRNA